MPDLRFTVSRCPSPREARRRGGVTAPGGVAAPDGCRGSRAVSRRRGAVAAPGGVAPGIGGPPGAGRIGSSARGRVGLRPLLLRQLHRPIDTGVVDPIRRLLPQQRSPAPREADEVGSYRSISSSKYFSTLSAATFSRSVTEIVESVRSGAVKTHLGLAGCRAGRGTSPAVHSTPSGVILMPAESACAQQQDVLGQHSSELRQHSSRSPA